MKKVVMTLAFALALTGVHAQTENNNTFNKWSIDLAAGVNKPQRPFSDGYYTNTLNPWTGDIGVRYMFNNKFGLKADFGYNSFTAKGSSIDFDSKYYRADLQAVANLGRIMNFETWTNTFGLLAHAGFGLGQIENKDYHIKDRVGNFIAGVTGQIRLSNRVALTGDFSTILNASQDATFDGTTLRDNRGFSGILFNGTVGLNVYLGKNTKHADWVVTSNDTDIAALENKVADLEEQVKKIPTQKEVVIEKQISTPATVTNDELIKKIINDKYYSVYFDFNKTTPIENSTAAIDVVLNYLRRNPSASLDLVGYADQVGKNDYNEKLSYTRASNVKTIFEKAGIASSRLNVIGNGADTSIQKDSEEARRLARRVTFIVK
ncbi:OmpA family protein [Flavobacterium nitrogenifigens]|uniref:OmpA-OmpF porin, OOP family n=1 Tax=Flavobacterium nitrogenifigens TaxID=1617283 RepID=A0A521D0B8_9FLAO|nr:OmpA family protein [Flavobacterium nitrogenifigens]KAF2332089.1 OmpA family protein [Flavobacterium nitrogenifigens]SMO64340.1 OmpA-OmpF porin, OOP family [Flavobacterium nitrogenifigens]